MSGATHNVSAAVAPGARWPALDGLRGLMTIGVFLAHVRYSWVPGSILFMDTFFMMSSFFITRLLLKDWGRSGTLHFRNFYTRRVRRLVPAMLVMVIAVTAFTWFYLGHRTDRMLNVVGTMFYFANWLRALEIQHEIFLGHTWSLSIEEQFYLLWPVLLYAGLRWGPAAPRTRERFWVLTLGGLVLGVFIWRWYLATHGASVARLYNGTDMRLDSLALGALIALMFDHPTYQRAMRRLSHPAVTWALLLIVFAGGLTVSYFDRAWYAWQQAVFVLISGALLTSLLNAQDRWGLDWALQNPVSLYLGAICYGMYLWHYPIIEICRTVFGLSVGPVFWISAPLTLALAGLSYHWIELPALQRSVGSAR